MFSGATPSEYDDIVNKTTDENLTSENWELILNLCDKVQDEGQTGAHAAIAAILKRLAHRNPNVQLYALSLAEALSKNLDIVVHREISSRAFTQGLEKLITDRNTHEKVRRRALGLVATWTADFEKDTSLGIMEDCYNNLKAKNYKFEQSSEPQPPAVDDEIRRKEEEELQRVLEMSMQDRGGRSQWSQYSQAPATSSSTATGPQSASNKSTAATNSSPTAAASHPFAQPKYPGGGYVPARTPSPVAVVHQPQQQQQHNQQPQTQPQSHNHTSSIPSASAASSSATRAAAAAVAATTTAASSTADTSVSAMAESGSIVTRVRALHTFAPTEPGELAFEKGDIIKVVDRGYKDWWRGQLKGRTGIFPVNYVEAMPEPTAAELAKEAEQEAAVFAQAVNVEKLLNMLRALDPAKDNLADNEEIQELYRSSMALRPKIVKLIDKYSQKRADLVSMNETFVRARTIFDRMMEESLARHTGMYEQAYHPSQYSQGRPDSGGPGRRQDYQPPSRVPQAYGWNPNVFEQPNYNAYIGPANAYPGQMQIAGPSQDPAGVSVPYGGTTPGPSGLGPQQQQPQGYTDPNVSSPYGPISAPGPSTSQQQQQQPIQAGYGAVGQSGYGHQQNVSYTQQGPLPYPTQQQPVQQQLQQQQPISQQPIQAQAMQQQPNQTQAGQQQPITQSQPVQQQPVQAQPVQQPTQAQPLQQASQSQPVQQQPIQAQQAPYSQQNIEHEQPLQQMPNQTQPETVQAQLQPQPQAQAQTSSAANAVSSQSQAQPQAQPQPQAQQQQQPAGPPYIYDPNTTYADPNVQAWAQYYAQGGTDLAGSVYFFSIPGLTDNRVPGSSSPQQREPQQAQQAHNQVQQQQHSANGISGHQSSEGYNTSVQQQQQQQQQPHQAQLQVSETNNSYAAASQQQEQSSPLQEIQPTQLSQYQQQQQQPPIQDQVYPQPKSPSRSLHEYDYAAQNPYLQRQHSPVRATDVAGPIRSSPTRSTFSLNRGSSLSAGGIGSAQAGIGRATGGGGSMHATTSATPSWVLPKKTPPATVAGGSPTHVQNDVGGSGVLGQFGGISLSDPAGGNGGEGVSHNSPNQGVGMLA